MMGWVNKAQKVRALPPGLHTWWDTVAGPCPFGSNHPTMNRAGSIVSPSGLGWDGIEPVAHARMRCFALWAGIVHSFTLSKMSELSS